MRMDYKDLSEMTIMEYCRRLKDFKGNLAARSLFINKWKEHKQKLKNQLC